MALTLVGKDPNTPNTGSPTVWLDDSDGSLVIQGWRIADEATIADIHATGPLPDHETVLRLPARMRSVLERALERGRADDL